MKPKLVEWDHLTESCLKNAIANMSFLDFFFYKGKPGIFFAVEIGAVMSALIPVTTIKLPAAFARLAIFV